MRLRIGSFNLRLEYYHGRNLTNLNMHPRRVRYIAARLEEEVERRTGLLFAAALSQSLGSHNASMMGLHLPARYIIHIET